MKKVTIAVGTDHRGFAMKEYLKSVTATSHYALEWVDVGAHDAQRSDYPVFAHAVVRALQDKQAEYGVLLCGSGIGMAIAANRVPGMRAAVVWSADIARQAKEDDNVTILVLPADYCTLETVRAMLCAWLDSSFKQGRYQERLSMLDDLMLPERQ